MQRLSSLWMPGRVSIPPFAIDVAAGFQSAENRLMKSAFDPKQTSHIFETVLFCTNTDINRGRQFSSVVTIRTLANQGLQCQLDHAGFVIRELQTS